MAEQFKVQSKTYDISNPYKATLKTNKRITPPSARDEVREIVLDVPAASFVYVEGQSVGVLAPPPYEFGNDQHMRLYSIASTRKGEKGNREEIALCVQRCFYIDSVSGERYPGKCSNYLCDLKPGSDISITGPYGRHFVVPRDNRANILMVATGTGIAPFRAFIKHIVEEDEPWEGQIRLFFGAKTDLDLLYMNEIKDETSHDYLKDTFKAIEALSPHPARDEPVGLGEKLEENATDVWELLQHPKTYVYVAGMRKAADTLDTALSHIAGSDDAWLQKKRELFLDDRWAEHLYD